MAALFAEESLSIAYQRQCRTTVRAGCGVPAFCTLDESRETADVEQEHGVLALIIPSPEELHRTWEENTHGSRLLLQDGVLTPHNEGGRLSVAGLDH